MAGAICGSVTRRKTASGPAPSIRAASSLRGSTFAHSADTVRTTIV